MVIGLDHLSTLFQTISFYTCYGCLEALALAADAVLAVAVGVHVAGPEHEAVAVRRVVRVPRAVRTAKAYLRDHIREICTKMSEDAEIKRG
jgi:hypothetical protein